MQILISIVLAIIGTVGLELQYLICGQGFSGSLLMLPIVGVIFIAYYFSLKKQKNFGLCGIAGVLSVIYASFLVLGMQLDILTGLVFSILTFLNILLVMIAIFPFIILLLMWLENGEIKPKENNAILYKCFIALIMAWCMSYLALFPGVYGLDAPYWYYEFSHADIGISSQWSPFYCGVFYFFVRMGERIFHSSVLGFGIFTFLQMIISLYAVWNILVFINRKLNEKFVVAATFFFLVPIHVILALTSAQDALFSVCFAMAVLSLIEFVLDEKNFWSKKINIIKLIIWLCLMCIMRNNGLYAILVMLAIMFFLRVSKKMLLSLILVVMLVVLYQGPVYNVLGIEKGTAIREMLSLPLQQMAYVYNYSENITDRQRDDMQEYISDEGWKSYEPCISDHVKSQLKVEEVKKNKIEFLRLYLQCFKADPGAYLQAAGLQTFGLWYPNKVWPDPRPWHPYIDLLCYNTDGWYGMSFSINRNSLFPAYETLLKNLFGDGVPGDGYGGNLKMCFTKIPILDSLCQIGTYTCFLIFEFLYAIYKRNKSILIILGLEIGLWLTVFLSPVIMYRYCAPFVFSAPLYGSLLLITTREKHRT